MQEIKVKLIPILQRHLVPLIMQRPEMKFQLELNMGQVRTALEVSTLFGQATLSDNSNTFSL